MAPQDSHELVNIPVTADVICQPSSDTIFGDTNNHFLDLEARNLVVTPVNEHWYCRQASFFLLTLFLKSQIGALELVLKGIFSFPF